MLSGYSAAQLLGAGFAPADSSVEVTVPGGDFRERPGLSVHRDLLAEDEVTAVDGVTVTTPLRTAWDLARWARWRGRMPGAIDLADPRAESPMETRSRLVLVRRGLPRPELQFEVYDSDGRFVARLDMAYRGYGSRLSTTGGVTCSSGSRRRMRTGPTGWTNAAGRYCASPLSTCSDTRTRWQSGSNVPSRAVPACCGRERPARLPDQQDMPALSSGGSGCQEKEEQLEAGSTVSTPIYDDLCQTLIDPEDGQQEAGSEDEEE